MSEADTYRYPHGRIVIFARAPVPGQVKTRLAGGIGAQRAAGLYSRLLDATVATARAAAQAPLRIQVAGDLQHPRLLELAREDIGLGSQHGDDLGERMYNALCEQLQTAEFCVLIGSDCPVMSVRYLAAACERLQAGDEVVLGPAEDGGYVLIGMRRCDASLFRHMPWSSPRVLPETRRRIAALGWRWSELDTLWDLDTVGDLARWQASGLPELMIETEVQVHEPDKTG